MRAMKGEGTPGEIHLIQEIELIAHGIRLETNTESLFVTKIVVFISSVGNVTWWVTYILYSQTSSMNF